MALNSKIEWCDHTFTPRPRTSASNWKLPVNWNFEAAEYPYLCGECGARFKDPETLGNPWSCSECNETLTTRRPRVFCASLADWLDEVPIEWLADLLKLIHDTPNLDWLLLTKRPENWRDRLMEVRWYHQNSDAILPGGAWASTSEGKFASWLADWLSGIPPKNVWIGTTVEDQQRADERIPELLKIPARVRFLSCEPLLGELEIDEYLDDLVDGGYVLGSGQIHWVICGGESGPKARPMHPDWARSLRDQCQAAGVPFFFKQWGEWLPHSQTEYRGTHFSNPLHRFDVDNLASRIGKKAAGRLLDGREWSEFPVVTRS